MGYKLTWAYIGQTKVRPKGWSPSANTLIYLPLDSTNLATNFWTLNKTFTVSGWVTWGSNYAEVTSYWNWIYIWHDADNSDYSTWTVSLWCYITWFKQTGHFASQIVGIGNYGAGDNKNLDTQSNSIVISDWNWYNWNYNSNYMNAWHNVIITTWGAYVDWTALTPSSTWSGTTINTYNIFLLYNPRVSGSWTTGKISQFIFENVERTAQEIADYFNQTKSNYGL